MVNLAQLKRNQRCIPAVTGTVKYLAVNKLLWVVRLRKVLYCS